MVKVEPKAPEPVEEPEPAAEERSGGGDDEDAEPIGWVTALYDFAGDGDDELPVKIGDRVEIYAEVEGWYTGVKDGKYGLLPKVRRETKNDGHMSNKRHAEFLQQDIPS